MTDYQPEKPIDWDGVDIAPILFENESLPERDLYWIWNSKTDRWALRFGNWKIVKYGVGEPTATTDWQLFNLENDPKEKNDIAKQHPEVAEMLHQRFLSQRVKDSK
jgi:arylsulfatase A-like enzyme